MAVNDLEDDTVSLYQLMRLGEESDEEHEDMKEHAIAAHNIGRGKSKF